MNDLKRIILWDSKKVSLGKPAALWMITFSAERRFCPRLFDFAVVCVCVVDS